MWKKRVEKNTTWSNNAPFETNWERVIPFTKARVFTKVPDAYVIFLLVSSRVASGRRIR